MSLSRWMVSTAFTVKGIGSDMENKLGIRLVTRGVVTVMQIYNIQYELPLERWLQSIYLFS